MINIISVFLYFAILLAVGIYTKSTNKNFSQFARINNSAIKNQLMLIATIFVSTIGGGTIFGITEKAFIGNIAYSYSLLAVIPIDIIIAIFIIPRIAKHYGAESIGDIMSVYYNNTGRIIAGMGSILVSIGLLSAQISVSSRIFEYMLKIDYISGTILSYTIVVIYTTIGGFRSIVFTNQLQFFAMLIAIPIIPIFGINKIGVIEFFTTIPYQKISFINNKQLIEDIFFITLNFSVMTLFPNFIQRILITNNFNSTSKAIYIKSILYSIFLILITLTALVAYNMNPYHNPRLIFPFLIEHIIPNFLQGIVIIGLLASIMSTADSDLNISSITLVKDLLNPLFKFNNPKKMLRIAQITNIIIASSSIFIALYFNSVVDLVIFMSSFWSPIVLIPLLFALFNIIINYKLIIFNTIFSIITILVWNSQFFYTCKIKSVFIGTITNLLLFLFEYLIIQIKNKFINKQHCN